MKVGFNSYSLYSYSPRLNENNAESKQKMQRQNNNYDVAFGQFSPQKRVLACFIGVVLGLGIDILSGGFFSVKLHDTIFHPNGKERTVQTGSSTSTKNVFEQAIEELERSPKCTKQELQEAGDAFVQAYERAKNAIPTERIKLK